MHGWSLKAHELALSTPLREKAAMSAKRKPTQDQNGTGGEKAAGKEMVLVNAKRFEGHPFK